MPNTVNCPACTQACSLPDGFNGGSFRCPTCQSLFLIAAANPPLASTPAPAIRCQCPNCKAIIEAPPDRAGDKIACFRCGQRLQIPVPPLSPITTATNKTRLAPLF